MILNEGSINFLYEKPITLAVLLLSLFALAFGLKKTRLEKAISSIAIEKKRRDKYYKITKKT